MPKDSLVVERTSGPTKRKQKENKCATTFQDQRSLKTLQHLAMQRRRESISKNTSITQQR